MQLTNCKLEWIKGEHGYKQGIKGRRNYKHVESGSYYNGYGGARMNIDMALNLYGIDTDTDEKITIDLKETFLESLGRKKMSDKLYESIANNLPNIVIIDDTTKQISSESIALIKEKAKL